MVSRLHLYNTAFWVQVWPDLNEKKNVFEVELLSHKHWVTIECMLNEDKIASKLKMCEFKQWFQKQEN